MQRRIIYDEAETGKILYESGFTDGFEWKEALLITKYMRHILGFTGDATLKKEIVKFFKKNDPEFRYVRSMKTVRNLVNRSKNVPKNTGRVEITESELSFIRTIRNFRQQKIILALLLIAKRKTNSGYISRKDWIDVKNCLREKVVNCEIQKIFRIFQLRNKDRWIESTGSSQLLFIDNNSKVVITIKDDNDARNISKLYEEYCGGKLEYCRNCDAEFIRTGKTHYYCEKCSREREANRIHRKKRGRFLGS